MARFRFNMRSIVTRFSAHATVSQRSLRALHLIDEEALPQGPGWFDSSWDLIRGLDVNEGQPADLKLNQWLEACVRASAPWADRQAPPVVPIDSLLPDALSAFGIEGLALV